MVKKRKLVVDDDEDLDPRTDHLRGDTTLTRTPVRSNRIIVDDISESEEFTNTQYEVTGGRRLGRHCFAGPSGAQLEGRSSSRLAADNLQSSQQSSTMHVRFIVVSLRLRNWTLFSSNLVHHVGNHSWRT